MLAMLMGLILAYIIYKTTKGLGEGDIGLYGLCALSLGKGYVVYMISLSFILASIYCIYKSFVKKDNIKEIPFAPFISLSTLVIMITDYEILRMYFDIISS